MLGLLKNPEAPGPSLPGMKCNYFSLKLLGAFFPQAWNFMIKFNLHLQTKPKQNATNQTSLSLVQFHYTTFKLGLTLWRPHGK